MLRTKKKLNPQRAYCPCALSTILTSFDLNMLGKFTRLQDGVAQGISFAILDGIQITRNGYALTNKHHQISSLKSQRIVPILRLHLDDMVLPDEELYQRARAMGYEGILIQPIHYRKSIFSLLENALLSIQKAELFTALWMPFQNASVTPHLMEHFQNLAHFFFLDMDCEEDFLTSLDHLTDATPKRLRYHTLVSYTKTKRSHAQEHDFLNTIEGIFERISYGCFAGVHFSADNLSQCLISHLTLTFNVQKGYQTALPCSGE